ncbi:hypothetical protein BASA81_006159 [Batrachochytrium salamandrivorans]|nr:hypothetical protein BASA81_006159 [Batrachochytrium salamandrivorans]
MRRRLGRGRGGAGLLSLLLLLGCVSVVLQSLMLGNEGPPDYQASCEWNVSQPAMPMTTTTLSPYILVIIPTVPRQGASYLSQTLAAIDAQIGSIPSIRICVVHNVRGNTPHLAFRQERARRVGDVRFDFIEQANLLAEPPNVGRDGESNIPNALVQQQTRDIVNTLLVVSNKYSPRYVVFQEDDFVWCQSALFSMAYIAARLEAQHRANWLVARFSFGFNGFMLHGGADVRALAGYLHKHQTRRPPDHLLVEWFSGETNESLAYKQHRVHAAYKYNLFIHRGTISSLRSTGQPLYISCWRAIKPPIVFPVEAFAANCGDNKQEDISPCHIASPCEPWGGLRYNGIMISRKV